MNEKNEIREIYVDDLFDRGIHPDELREVLKGNGKTSLLAVDSEIARRGDYAVGPYETDALIVGVNEIMRVLGERYYGTGLDQEAKRITNVYLQIIDPDKAANIEKQIRRDPRYKDVNIRRVRLVL